MKAIDKGKPVVRRGRKAKDLHLNKAAWPPEKYQNGG